MTASQGNRPDTLSGHEKRHLAGLPKKKKRVVSLSVGNPMMPNKGYKLFGQIWMAIHWPVPSREAQCRKRAGLSQVQLASALKLSRNSHSHPIPIRRDRRQLTAVMIVFARTEDDHPVASRQCLRLGFAKRPYRANGCHAKPFAV